MLNEPPDEYAIVGLEHRPKSPEYKSCTSLSQKDIDACADILKKGPVDLSQEPLESVLIEIGQSERKWKADHIVVAVNAYKDFLAAMRNDEIEHREKLFASKLKPSEGKSHYFYRYCKARCNFRPSKASKFSTYLRAKLHQRLTPVELRQEMMERWTLEKGYEEALQIVGEHNRGTAESGGSTKKAEKTASMQEQSNGTGNDDPPRRPKSKAGNIASGEDGDDEEDAQPAKSTSREPSIRTLGSPHFMGNDRKCFGLLSLSLMGNPYEIKFLSPKKAKQWAERYLEEEE